MNADDRVRLVHMRESAQAALTFVEGNTRESLDGDLKLVFALVRAVEIIGEAAARVSEQTRQQYPQIPWKRIIGMRNILIHNYFDVDLDKVWETTTDDLPELIAYLDKALADSE